MSLVHRDPNLLLELSCCTVCSSWASLWLFLPRTEKTSDLGRAKSAGQSHFFQDEVNTSGYPWEGKEKTGFLALDPLDGSYCGLSLALCRLGGVRNKISFSVASTLRGTLKGKPKLSTMKADVEKHKHGIPCSYENMTWSAHVLRHLGALAFFIAVIKKYPSTPRSDPNSRGNEHTTAFRPLWKLSEQGGNCVGRNASSREVWACRYYERPH